MRKAFLCTLAVGVFSTAAVAAEVDTDHLMFPEDVAEAIAMADERYALEARTADQQDYTSDKAWVGATKVEENAQNQQETKKLNRRFVEE